MDDQDKIGLRETSISGQPFLHKTPSEPRQSTATINNSRTAPRTTRLDFPAKTPVAPNCDNVLCHLIMYSVVELKKKTRARFRSQTQVVSSEHPQGDDAAVGAP